MITSKQGSELNLPETKEVDIDKLEEQFKAFVYAQNGKVTNERLAMLRTLYLNDGHFSVDDILLLMKDEDIQISRATVYRTIDLLVQSGLIKKLALDGQETRYESAQTSGHHDHIICSDCHKITEFFSPELEELQDDILSQYHFKMERHVHLLYAHCTKEDCEGKKDLVAK